MSLAIVSLAMLSLAPSGVSAVSGSPPATHSITYRLGSTGYPPGFSLPCGRALSLYAVLPAGPTSGFSFGGGIPTVIRIGPCHAKKGDWIKATLTDVYGHVVFISHPSPGNPRINDTGLDAHAKLVVTDLTSGASATKDVFYSY
jgi:hypothetical protein